MPRGPANHALRSWCVPCCSSVFSSVTEHVGRWSVRNRERRRSASPRELGGSRRPDQGWRARYSWVCAAMINQVQRSAASGVRTFGPAESLLEQPEGVLKIEPAQERAPPAIHV